ncbi:hypothetical protein AR546_18605 [Leptospira interrogans serovar Canicola]|nr:hypothetical protein B2G47_07250 [Leptospira interrogans serovar Canicola]KYZ62459.1 hypothetical protein AWU66_11540 [Leptospira interrogans serovar Pomona]OQM31631.1 hypothetical protein DV38_06440 [Leptospira interrogans]OLZ30094.1 hypothetical protein AR546_18605 [Leptospira interrogans serovar Canicola]OMH68821.1 hypothetical protein BW243_06310 [Leptospira interrogans serovar Pomona]
MRILLYDSLALKKFTLFLCNKVELIEFESLKMFVKSFKFHLRRQSISVKIIRIVEKLILYGFSLYGNGRLKRFVNCCYGIFQQLYYIS